MDFNLDPLDYLPSIHTPNMTEKARPLGLYIQLTYTKYGRIAKQEIRSAKQEVKI